MRKLILSCCMGAVLAIPAAAMAGPQQERMRACNKDAKEKSLKGDERKAFMKNCLRKKAGGAEGEKADSAQGAAGSARSKK